MKYLTLEEIKRQVCVDNDLDDILLTELADAAEQACANHIGQPVENVLEAGQVPPALKRAMLMFVGTLYSNRESENAITMRTSAAYEALIGPYRKY